MASTGTPGTSLAAALTDFEEGSAMSDILAGHFGSVGFEIPHYPMARAAGCPLAPARTNGIAA